MAEDSAPLDREPEHHLWCVFEYDYEPAREAYYATIFTTGNGYLGTRGTFEEAEPGQGSLGVYIAGFFDQLSGQVESLVNGPNWLGLRVWLGETVLTPGRCKLLEYRRWLDMRDGQLHRLMRLADEQGRITTLRFRRFVSLAHQHQMAIQLSICAENYSDTVRVESWLEADCEAGGYRHLEPVRVGICRGARGSEPEGIYLLSMTQSSSIVVGVASRLMFDPPRSVTLQKMVVPATRRIAEIAELRLKQGEPVVFAKKAVIYTSRDDTADCVASATEELERFAMQSYDQALAESRRKWDSFWRQSDLKVGGDAFLQLAVRFACYHLRIAGSEDDPRVSIGAKTLSGPGYRGHVFWDTEMFMLPFFAFTQPTIARNLLMYRYVTLEGARRKAAALGHRGACYPWESARLGDEQTPAYIGTRIDERRIRIHTGRQEIHVTGAVAWGIWQYYLITGDVDFLVDYGAEIILSTARFWYSRAEFLESKNCYEYKHIMGPDEGHEGVNNNVYTNKLAQWNIYTGVKVANQLARIAPLKWKELSGRLHIDAYEIQDWYNVAEHIVIPQPREDGVIEQFDGYFSQEDIPDYKSWAARVSHEVRQEKLSSYSTQLIKQPDVVMMLFLFDREYSDHIKRANLAYYGPRTTHRSSLGLSIHAILYAQIGRREKSYRRILTNAQMDLRNYMGNTEWGIHGAAAGGMWMSLVYGLAGLRVDDDGLRIDPHLPPEIMSLDIPIVYRGQPLRIFVDRTAVRIQCRSRWTSSLQVRIYGQQYTVDPHIGCVAPRPK